jgi:hypothetical protein
MRLAILLASLLMLSACSKTESDATLVFASAFSMQAPPGNVVALNGYRLERRKFFKVSGEMWRLHLAGPGARQFVRERWRDLRLGNPRVFLQGTQTPWFAPGREVKYFTYISPSDPAVTVMERDGSEEVFIAYDDTR